MDLPSYQMEFEGDDDSLLLCRCRNCSYLPISELVDLALQNIRHGNSDRLFDWHETSRLWGSSCRAEINSSRTRPGKRF